MERRWQPSTPWDAQPITNGLTARVPEHTLSPPVPIMARVVWETDGEEHVDTVALGVAARPDDVFAAQVLLRGLLRRAEAAVSAEAGATGD